MSPDTGGCPTCGHTLGKLHEDRTTVDWHCPRCGTLISENIESGWRDTYVPKLVERCRDLQTSFGHNKLFTDGWHRLGIAESINRPEDRDNG